MTNDAMALLADHIIVDSKGKGIVANVILTGYPILEQFAKDFAAEIDKNCPDCTETLGAGPASPPGAPSLADPRG